VVVAAVAAIPAAVAVGIQAVVEHLMSAAAVAHRTSAEAVAALPISPRHVLAVADIRAAAVLRTLPRTRLRTSLRMRLHISVRLAAISRVTAMVAAALDSRASITRT
jgi:hypothetical protein